MDRTTAALLIVSINTGAYISRNYPWRFISVDEGQFGAANALLALTHPANHDESHSTASGTQLSARGHQRIYR